MNLIIVNIKQKEITVVILTKVRTIAVSQLHKEVIYHILISTIMVMKTIVNFIVLLVLH
jgi:hypothetical protein